MASAWTEQVDNDQVDIMKYFQKLVNAFNNFAVGMDSRDWAVAAVIMLVVGVICMRGAASKSNL